MANVGDLFVNFKVNTDGLNAGAGALGSFVGKSRKDIAAMNGAVDALSMSLSKLGIDPSFIIQMRDLIGIGTKQLPKFVDGVAAFQRQMGSIGGMGSPAMPAMPAIEMPKIETSSLDKARNSLMEVVNELDALDQAAQESDLEKFVVNRGGAITQAFRSVADSAKPITTAFASFGASIKASIASIGPAITALPTQFRSAIDSITSSIKGLPSFRDAFASLKTSAQSIPSAFSNIASSITASMQSASASSKAAFAAIGTAFANLPQAFAQGIGGIKSGLASLPAAGVSAFEAIKTGALKFDIALTGIATRAATAGRAIGAALYTALGPIGLILAAAGALYAIINKFVGDAEARVAESNARIEAATQRTTAAIEKTLQKLGDLRQQRERVESKGSGIEADIKGLEALLNARGDGIRFTEEQIARERELRDEIEASASAQKEVAAAAEQRAQAEKSLKAAQAKIDSMNGQKVSDTVLNEAVTNLRNAESIVSAQRAQEAEAKKLAAAAAENLALEQQRLDLVAQVAAQRRVEAENEKRKAELANILQGLDDERLKITMEAADYEDLILKRRLAQAGIEDPAQIAKVQAAQAALETAKQAADFTSEMNALEEQLASTTMSRAEAERAAYEAKIASKNLTAEQTAQLLAQYDMVKQMEQAQKERDELAKVATALADEQARMEQQMLEATLGKAAAERIAYENKLRSLGISGDELQSLLSQRDALAEMAKQVEERKKQEQAMQKLQDDRAKAEEALASAQESARVKAAEDDLRRQQLTENISTAIGGITIAGASDAIDIDKRVFDETKKQTDELKKINEALRSGGVAVLT